VYVVQLADAVWNNARFRRCNPDYRLGMPFVYVGMTGPRSRPALRQAQGRHPGQHLRARPRRALLPQLYAVYNPMPYRAACEMEVELGIALREKGYGVWQA
jgi:hypothetical protein